MKSLSGILLKLVLMALAFVAAALLLRDGLAIGAHIPLDPDEGWNAYLARAAMAGAPLYPHGLLVNNYPPLSFYVMGGLGRMTGDPLLAGRIVSLAAFLAAAATIVSLLRQMAAEVPAALFGGLFFAGALLIASDYVAMNDPQLLGHALQLAGLSLLLQPRRKILAAAALFTMGLFVKDDLIALPLAAALWLLWQDRREGLRLIGTGLLLGVAGLVAVRLILHADLLAALASPRRWTFANFQTGIIHFLAWSWAALALTLWLAARRGHDMAVRLVLLYAGIALPLGALFASGDGVDANIFFDTAIALGLGTGLGLRHFSLWRGPLALLAAAPLLLFHFHHRADGNFAYTEAFARAARDDIAFLRDHPGPALCENLTLCYWAGKDEAVDVFNLSEAIATGARRDDNLASLLATQHFRSIVLDRLTPFALGPQLKGIMLAHYRTVRQDDNGIFLEPR